MSYSASLTPSSQNASNRSLSYLAACDHYAGTERRMLKALALQQQLGPVFDITFDCEDGAPVGAEYVHAQQVAALINSRDNLFNRVGVRIHASSHRSFSDDIALLVSEAGARLAYITLPKVHGVEEVVAIIEKINQTANIAGLSSFIPIHVLIETHGALRDVNAIAAVAQVECLSFGLMDYVSSYRGAIPASAMASPGQFEHPIIAQAMREIAIACHAHGKVPSHNVSIDITNPEVARTDALRARWEFAYTRKWSIHPEQILPIVQAFAPGTEEIEEAAAILLAAEEASWGPIQYKGKLHDYASYRYYWFVLKRGESNTNANPVLSSPKVRALLAQTCLFPEPS